MVKLVRKSIWPEIVVVMRSEVFVNAVNDAESDESEDEDEGNESQVRVNAFKKSNQQHLTEFMTAVNTNQINIEGFINHHLNVLLNGSWRDNDKNLTYFDFKIVPNDQVHRNYKIGI